MELVKKIETKLADVYKGAPALPKKAKDTIVEYLPYLVLLGGLLQLWAAYVLWRYVDRFGEVSDYLNSVSRYFANTEVGLTSGERTVIYVGLATLAISAVLLLVSFSPLKQKARKGWELLFLVSLVQLVYGFIAIFMHGQGFGSFIVNVIAAAIGFYFLFQIRDHYKAKAAHKRA